MKYLEIRSFFFCIAKITFSHLSKIGVIPEVTPSIQFMFRCSQFVPSSALFFLPSLPSVLLSILGSNQGPCVTFGSISDVSFPLKHIFLKNLIHFELSRPVLTESYFLDLTDCLFMVSLTRFCLYFLQLWTEA